jgi:hypothetical protein
MTANSSGFVTICFVMPRGTPPFGARFTGGAGTCSLPHAAARREAAVRGSVRPLGARIAPAGEQAG